MDLTASFASDWRTWDQVEQVGIEYARSGQNAAGAVPVAKRRNLTKKELLASGGVYTGLDRVWLVPQSLLPPGFAFKPADVVIDLAGTRWTVLEADHGKFGQTWRLTTRDLVLANDLRDTIDVERATISYDVAGAAIKTFPPAGGLALYPAVAARVQQTGESVVDQRGIRGPLRKYDVIVGRQVPLLSTEDRVKWTDPSTKQVAYLDIVGIRQPQQIDQLTVVECEQRP